MRKMTRELAERRMADVGTCKTRLEGKLARYPGHPDAAVMQKRLKEYAYALKSYALTLERFDLEGKQMAAGTWTIYNKFKEYMADGTIDLDTSNFRMTLHTTASNAATATLSTFASVTNEVTSAAKYSSSGQALAAVTWATGASAGEMRFDATANVWSASGATIADVRYAVIWASGGKLVAYAALSTAQFSISSGDTLTVTPSALGIFELN